MDIDDNVEQLEHPLVELSQMSIAAIQRGKPLKFLVKDLHLSLRSGEMVGLIGESGSGKSLTAAAMMGLLPQQIQVLKGQIRFRGMDLQQMNKYERRGLLGKEMSIVFQDHQGSLTPHRTIGKQMVETIQCHQKLHISEAKNLALSALEDVLLPAQRVFESYPFQLSGGQGQRVAIAMAMMLNPALLIADEPTTALDILTQQQILNLLAKLQRETKCTVLFISHDLTQVLHRTDRVLVMYGGQIVEEAPTSGLQANAQHPYTRALLKARPTLQHQADRLWTISGDPGLVAEAGCPFTLRCPCAIEKCNQRPLLKEITPEHRVACHLTRAGREEEGV